MREVLGPGTILGYCTNVHGGVTWAQTKANLIRHAAAVRQIVCREGSMGVGLWFSAASARQMIEGGRVGVLADLLAENGLIGYTINGFPHGDFHQPIVKRHVYQPDWSAWERFTYTRDLVTILATILPRGQTGSISTLPIGWYTIRREPQRLETAVKNLIRMAEHLRTIEQEEGKLIHIDLEPEPGCFLERATDVTAFFREQLVPAAKGLDIHRYIRVCHDVCHAAVMFEDQAKAFDAYRADGIEVGKVQISSAPRIDFEEMDPETRPGAARALSRFREMRYLHQTVVRDAEGRTAFFEDLPDALGQVVGGQMPAGEWRVHFHIPVYLSEIGVIGTTQETILECVELLHATVEHWTVETYGWDVLPPDMQVESLHDGLARELKWVRDVSATHGSASE